jgi:hypothetical protein
MIEWVASDGRKGKLSGFPKPTLLKGPFTTANLPKAGEQSMNMGKKLQSSPMDNPAPPGTPAKAQLHATPAASDLVGGMWTAFGDMGGANTSVKGEPTAAAPQAGGSAQATATSGVPGADNASGFTKEQDEELLRRKTENETWAEIVTAMGKEKSELAKRFGQIKPPGWKPNPVDKGKNKGKKKGDQNQKKDEDKPKEAGVNNSWVVPNWDTAKANMGNTGGVGVNVWAQGNPNNAVPGQVWNPNQNAGIAWGNPGGAQPDQNKNDHKRGDANGKKGNAAANVYNGGANPPLVPVNFFNDVYPDELFSVDDLARISRILKRDHEQVWFRLSCAFKDKTGRHIHPDVFRQKLLGKTFKKGSGGGG